MACLDKPKFGGKGVRKARCMHKPKVQQRPGGRKGEGGAAKRPPSSEDAAARPKPPKAARKEPPRPPPSQAEEEANSIEKVLDARPRRSAAAAASVAAGPSSPRSILRAATAGGGAGGGGSGRRGEEEYLCKVRGLAHVHARWMVPADIRADGRLSLRALQHFLSRRDAGAESGFSETWTAVERVLAAREPGAEPIPPPAPGSAAAFASASTGPVETAGSAAAPTDTATAAAAAAATAAPTMLYLVKWEGLGYDGCTWERPETAGAAAIAAFEARKALLAAPATAPAAGDSEAGLRASLPPLGSGESARRLRDYQEEGLRWMRVNHAQGRSVLLGDEMGLGKTAQAVSMLRALSELHGEPPHASSSRRRRAPRMQL